MPPMVRHARVSRFLALIGIAGLAGLLPPPVGLAEVKAGPSYEVVDADQIYYGDGTAPAAPAVTVADDVWAQIPEYKKIVDEDLGEDDAAYHLLLAKATERFEKALAKVAKRDGYDMIGEVGAIAVKDKDAAKIPDITKDLIEIVSRAS